MSREQDSLPAENANPDSWEWPDESSSRWEVAVEVWQAFNTMWYGASAAQCASLHDSRSPFLALGPLATRVGLTSSMLVRECFVTMFEHVCATTRLLPEGLRGVIITGQPGVGKTLFLIYLLVRLLQLKQVVLFTLDNERVYLFYHKKVYTTYIPQLNAIQPELQLPKPKTSKAFIWSLFDVRMEQEPELLLVRQPCFPVQAASPDPIRFKIWSKERSPLHFSLPLWTPKELAQAFPYQSRYNLLSWALRQDLSLCDIDPLTPFPGSRALLNEFQQDGISLSPEEALDYLLGAAIDRFGYSARDVFQAVFRYHSSVQRQQWHQAAFERRMADLEEAVSVL